MVTPLFVFGAGPHGRVVRDAITSAGDAASGFVDDRPDLAGREVDGLKVYAAEEWLAGPAPRRAAVGIGNNVVRLAVIERMRASGHTAESVVHRSAVVATGVRLGEGTFVAMLAGLGTGCMVGAGVVVNTAAAVDHDGELEEGVYLSPGVCCAGSVRVGARAFIGAGAIIGPGVEIGHDAIVGAGSVVLSDLPPLSFSLGLPARVQRIRERSEPVDWRRLLAGKGTPQR